MKKTKVAICLRDMRIGGVESVAIAMMDAMLATGRFDIVFVSYAKITTPVYRDWFAAHGDVVQYALYPSRYLGTNLPHFFVRRLFRHVARDIYRWARRVFINRKVFADVDVFIDFYDFSFAREFKKFRGPKIAWWHSSSVKFTDGNYARYLPDYDKMVVLTDGFIDDVRPGLGAAADNIVRIYNPMDMDAVRRAANRATVRADGDYFSYVARLDGDKDADTVIHAFDMFWRGAGRPDMDLVIVGDGHLGARLRDMAAALDAGTHIRFTGALPNPFGVMAGARANILSSYAEGMGLSVLEGLALRVPEIAADCHNGPREILMDGKLGLLFTPGDVAGLARCMGRVYAGDAPTFSDAQYASAMRRFDIHTFIDNVTGLVGSVSD